MFVVADDLAHLFGLLDLQLLFDQFFGEPTAHLVLPRYQFIDAGEVGIDVVMGGVGGEYFGLEGERVLFVLELFLELFVLYFERSLLGDAAG